jgi:hypothetical protein
MPVVERNTDLDYVDLAAFVAREQQVRDRLVAGVRLRVETPFRYPGRRGAVVVELVPGPPEISGSRPVRLTDGGLLIKSLDEQGLDLALDMVVSKTVFHAVREVEGAAVGSGEIYLDSTADTAAADLWRFLQLVTELIGLRHSKYKDALLQFSRRPENTPDLIGWEEH